MNKVTTLEYAKIADAVYNIDQKSTSVTSSWQVDSFECGLFKEGMSWGATSTDFKGCAYVSSARKEAVVALQGTVGSKGGDWFADLQIGIFGFIGMLPHYCGAAARLLSRTQEAHPGYAVSFVGHSLGGAMAQVLGHWSGLPFVTFNAPGMWGDIQRAKIAPWWSVTNSRLSVAGTFKGPLLAKQTSSTGRNFRNVFDPISAYGMHYGPVTRFWGLGVHSMEDVLGRISASRWSNISPLDPRFKEWGEL